MRLPESLPRRGVQLAIVACLAFSAFVPALSGAFVSDDRVLIGGFENLHEALFQRFWQAGGIERGQGLYAHAARPLVQLALHLEQRLFGDDPAGFHLVNLLLHVLNSLLVLRLLERRSETRHASWPALFGAALFAVHPAHAESVAWISGGTDLWMTALWLVALELFERRGSIMRALGTLAIVLAALAKEPVLVAPALILLDDWARGRTDERWWKKPLWATVGLLCVLSLRHALAVRAAITQGFALDQSLAALGWYVRIALFPAQLTFESQSYVLGKTGATLPSFSLVLATACLVAFVVLAIRAGKVPGLRGVLADAAWFVLPLAPACLLVSELVSDRFLYVPVIGLAALLRRALARGLLHEARALRIGSAVLAVSALALCLPQSGRAASHFLDDEKLRRSQVDARPDLPANNDLLAEALTRRERFDEARGYYETARARADDYGMRAWRIHVAVHLFTLPALARPAWDEQSQRAVLRACDLLLEEGQLELPGRAGPVRLTLTAEERAALRADDPSLVFTPCARAALTLGELARAHALAEAGLAARPRDIPSLELVAMSLARARRFDEARAKLTASTQAPAVLGLLERVRAARDASRAPTAANTRARALQDAHVSFILGAPEAARRGLDPWLRDNPTDHEVVHAYAQSYVVERRFHEANMLLARASASAPSDPYWPRAIEALAEAERALPPGPTR